MLKRHAKMVVLAALAATAQASTAMAACTAISTPQQLSNIRNNLSGQYCLTRNIDLGAIANWAPIGKYPNTFKGSLDGRNFAITRLRVRVPGTNGSAGLFGTIDGGAVRNLRLLGVDLAGGEGTGGGALAATADLATISNVHASGALSSTGRFGSLGGLVGHQFGGSIVGSSTAMRITCADGEAGGLVGYQAHDSATKLATIRNSSATGPISCVETDPSTSIYAGGLVGQSWGGNIQGSFATGAVTCRRAGHPYCGWQGGGLVGRGKQSPDSSIPGYHVRIVDSYATGDVTGWQIAGGLVPEMQGSISRSFALGHVTGSIAGGLVALNDGPTSQSYAGGRVTAVRDEFNSYGNVAGLAGQAFGPIVESFAFGQVNGSAPPSNNDGLVAFTMSDVKRSYWDTETTRQTDSHGGTGRTTAQFQAALPAGFSPTVWASTPGQTYPYFKASAGFQGTLATVVKGIEAFSALPIGQLDPAQYSAAFAAKNRASLSAVYTIIARAVGTTRDVPALRAARINHYWSSNAPAWTGPVIDHVTLGPLTGIAAAQPLGPSNVVGLLQGDDAVILRGAYKIGAAIHTHWMLATSYTVDGSGAINAIVADDPWTGKQVRIHPTTKAVVSPAGFPLAGFKVNGYQSVTFVQPRT